MENLHVRLDNPLIKRKEILRSAIDATRLLKEYEDNKGLFVRKHALVDKLKDEMDRIYNLNKKLSGALPKLEKEKKVPAGGVKEIKEINLIKEKPKLKDKLDMEIEEIQNKLDSIKI